VGVKVLVVAGGAAHRFHNVRVDTCFWNNVCLVHYLHAVESESSIPVRLLTTVEISETMELNIAVNYIHHQQLHQYYHGDHYHHYSGVGSSLQVGRTVPATDKFLMFPHFSLVMGAEPLFVID